MTLAPLLEAARDGDERAFGALTEPHRRRLHSHCYRMLGSRDDADDALQETLVRAWRGLWNLDDADRLPSWLFRIATNVCLDALDRRKRTAVVARDEPDADAVEAPPAVAAGPATSYERRELAELALVAALRHLPAKQRAALILSDVLDFSAREAAEALSTTPASVNSALQRARRVEVDAAEQPTPRTLRDVRIAAVVESYMQAIERDDVDAIVTLASEDTTWSPQDRAPCGCR